MTIWVVAADASKARLFSAEGRNSAMVEEDGFIHSQSRMKASELESDSPGRSFDSGGQGRHSMGKEQNVRDREAEVFAREICARVNQACHADKFEKVYLIAPPAFLGHIRTHLDQMSKSRVAGEVAKDVVSQNIQAIRGHLPDFL